MCIPKAILTNIIKIKFQYEGCTNVINYQIKLGNIIHMHITNEIYITYHLDTNITDVQTGWNEDSVCIDSLHTCTNGECIQPSAMCDNKPDCSDASDEDSSLCGNITFGYCWKCTYLKFVEANFKCRGINSLKLCV